MDLPLSFYISGGNVTHQRPISCGRYGLVICSFLDRILFSCCGLILMIT
jgi:hypothetical protein